jgi:thiamine biosynthesis protein ThiI
MIKISKKILVRYGEIFLKSKIVFKQFERKLLENIRKTLQRVKIPFKIEKERGRIFVLTEKEKEATRELGKVFGLVSFSPVYHLETSELKTIKKFCQEKFKNFLQKKETFAIKARRIGEHPYSSQDLENEVGRVIEGKVDLRNPTQEISLEVRGNNTYVFTDTFSGLGGLPVSTAGKTISFLSGGIDSAVASWLAMKRGCQVIFLHFHSFPLVSMRSIEKCQKVIGRLNDYQFKSKLILIPFQKIQVHLKTQAPARYLILLYRRSMIRIGQKIAKIEGAEAIITGESLAQVSSQTLSNLAAIEEAVKIPVFRPLIGMDKEEIVNLAKKIDTYDISILPQEDCCTLFVPKHPATKSDPKILKGIEQKLKIRKIESSVFREREEIII